MTCVSIFLKSEMNSRLGTSVQVFVQIQWDLVVAMAMPAVAMASRKGQKHNLTRIPLFQRKALKLPVDLIIPAEFVDQHHVAYREICIVHVQCLALI